MIHFPAMIKLEGDHELLYIASHDVLAASVLDGLIIGDDDWLIDATGQGFRLQRLEHNSLGNPEHMYTLDEVTQLIREHEFHRQQVCLTKIIFTDVSSAIESLVFSQA